MLVYGNVAAIRDPDGARRARRLGMMREQLAGADIRTAGDWLVAISGIGRVGRAQVVEHPNGLTVFAQRDPAGVECDLTDGAFVPAGDVTAVHVREDGRLRAVRSVSGTVPLYLAREGDVVAVSTTMEPIVRFALGHAELDPIGIAGWLDGFASFPGRHTWISGVRILEPGYALEVEGDSDRSFPYWQRPQNPRRPSDSRAQEAASVIRDEVIRVVESGTADARATLIALSGGADSSVVALLLGERLQRPFVSVTLEAGTTEELAEQRRVIGEITQRATPLRQFWLSADINDRVARLATAPRSFAPVAHPAIIEMPSILREVPFDVMLGGEWADEICGGDMTLPDWFEQTGPFTLLRRLTRLPRDRKDVARWVLHRATGRYAQRALPQADALTVIAAPAVREQYGRLLSSLHEEGKAARWRHLRRRLRRLEGVLATSWEAASGLGVLRLWPFLTRRTLEATMSVHPADLLGPGFKGLLRRGFPEYGPYAFMPKFAPPARAPQPVVVSGELPPELASIVNLDVRGAGELDALLLAMLIHLCTTLRPILSVAATSD